MAQANTYSCDPQCWVEAYADELYRYAFSRLNKHEQAEDVVQETFLSALKNLKNFRRDCAEKTWLYNILKNKITDQYRKNGREISESSNSQETENNHFYDHYFRPDGKYIKHWKSEAMPTEWSLSADTSLLNDEFMLILQDCLSYLPEKQAEVFRLKNIEDLSSKEICKELTVSASNLWVIIHRAKLQLRECLEKKGIKNG